MSVLAGLVLGISLLATFVVSIIAVVQRNHVTLGFVVLNYCLIIDSIIVVVIGSFVWFFTLQERVNFHEVWAEQTAQTRITLQDQVRTGAFITRLRSTDAHTVQMLRLL